MTDKPQTALIVDDDPDLWALLELCIQKMGYETHVLHNTQSAREWLETNTPDFFVLDIMMPDGNGLDLCRWIRGHKKFAKTPILVSSALKDDETVQDALEMCAMDFLRKPFSIDALQEKITRMMRA